MLLYYVKIITPKINCVLDYLNVMIGLIVCSLLYWLIQNVKVFTTTRGGSIEWEIICHNFWLCVY